MQLRQRSLTAGFTLVELMVASFIGLLTTTVAGQMMLNHLKTTERAEAFQRQRENWTRAASFIGAEVALSESIITDGTKVTIPTNCQTIFNQTGTQFKFALNIRQDVHQSIYAVRPSDEGWLAPNTLWRCGPSFDKYGNYLSIEEEFNEGPVAQILLDGLDNNDNHNGFEIEESASPGKLLKFKLSMVKLNQRNPNSQFSYSNQGSTRTRISPLYSRPTSGSLCTASNMVKFSPAPGSSSNDFKVNISENDLTPGQDVLICGKGLVTTIHGSSYDDIIESGASESTTIYGCNGNDVLEGTIANDTLIGDRGETNKENSENTSAADCPGSTVNDGDDILIGNGNNSINPEIIIGGNGFNRYIPGLGNADIKGGNNLDIVFFDKPIQHTDGNETKSNYSFSNCSRSSCTVKDTSNGPNLTYTYDLKGVEILIFPDQRIDLE